MKNIALIAFGVIVLAIAIFVVLIATLPTAKVTIVAIRPTGEVGTRTNLLGAVVSGPVWLFGITNVGRATARWNADVDSRPVNAPDGFVSKVGVGGLVGRLQAGEGLVTNMTVPTREKTEWSALVLYATLPTPFQMHLWDLGRNMPGMRRLCPQDASDIYFEPAWHTTTNATPPSSTVTNTP